MPGFLLCPKCGAATPAQEPQSRYRCRHCGHKWVSPQNSLNAAYLGGLEDVEVRLVAADGTGMRLPEFPAVVGRDTEFTPLQRNRYVSRRHCCIEYDAERCCFVVVAEKTPGGTCINGTPLAPGERCPLGPGDELLVANVPLHLECTFRRVRGVPSSVPGRAACRFPGMSPAYLSEGADGRLQVSDRAGASDVAVLSKVANGGWKILPLQRNNILLNGEAFVDAEIRGGETLCIAGAVYEYDAKDQELEPGRVSLGVDLDLRALAATYGEKTILAGLNCRIPRGKLTAVVGKSGCGKSTLIRLLSGLKAPASGSILVNGEQPADYEQWAGKHLSLVPQANTVHEDLTVLQNIGYAADIRMRRKMTPGLRQSIIDRVLRETGLEAYANQEVGSLSGGQQKRVNIAIEVVGNPDVLLLDEPTTGLDYATEMRIIGILQQMARQGRTILFVTHSLAALEAADHVLVLDNKGKGARVTAEGTPPAVLQDLDARSWGELYCKLMVEGDGEKSKPKPIIRIPWLSVLFSRQVAIWLNTPYSSAALLLGLPLLLGIMIRMAVSIDAPGGGDRMLFGLVAMFWLGMNQSVREIVKERNIFVQERSHHVSTTSYVFSKVLFFLLLSLPQAALLLSPLLWLNVNAEGDWFMLGQLRCTFSQAFPMFLLAGIVGSCLGLLGSALSLFVRSKGEVAAMLFAVIATLPQILFSSKVLPEGICKPSVAEHFYDWVLWHDGSRVAEWLSFGTFSRYLYVPLEAVATKQSAIVISHSYIFNCTILIGASLIMAVLIWLTLELYVMKSRR